MNSPLKHKCWCAGACPHAARSHRIAARRGPHIAERQLRHALLDAPNCAQAHLALARFMVHHNHAHAALNHVDRAANLAGATPAIALERANVLRSMARFPDCVAAAREAVAIAPDNPAAHAQLILTLEADGELELAREAVAIADSRFGARHKETRRAAALVDAAGKDYVAAIERLSADDLAPMELFDRGRAREKLADYPGAWGDFMLAKRMQRERGALSYPLEQVQRMMAALADAASPRRMAALRPCPTVDGPAPLFITGFPRSGTTMLEAAISAHPSIVAGDEMPFVGELIDHVPRLLGAPYPRALAAMAWAENFAILPLLRDLYRFKALQKLDSLNGAVYWTDKMLSNELHWPFLSLLFPRSRILHIRRHPLDIVTSCMSHSLIHGRNNALAPDWCALHYALTDDLCATYRRLLPALNLVALKYEDFVSDHKAAIDRALPHELAPDAACYDFHLNPWRSRTISHRQIKQPLYDSSIGRYKPFLEFLKPLVPIVRPTLEREGYTI